MSGPPTGLYVIIRSGASAPPPFPIGANDTGRPVEPVIAGGESVKASSPFLFSTNYACWMRSIPRSHLLSFLHDTECCFVVVRSGA